MARDRMDVMSGPEPTLARMLRVCAETGMSHEEYVYAYRAEIKRDRIAETQRARRIVALFSSPDLSGFVLENVICAFLARRFPEAYVLAGFKADPDYRELVGACNGAIDATLTFPPDVRHTILLDWFDVGLYAPVRGPLPWRERRLTMPDLVLTPTMLRADAAHLFGLGEAPPIFRLPPQREEEFLRGLVVLGLNPNRWFVCLQSTEVGDGSDSPAIESEVYQTLITRLITDHGGQVVRLGSADSSPVPDMDGLIDLSRISNSFPLQVAALRSARFFIGTDDGFLTLASAFCVPSAGVGLAGFARYLWNRDDIVLARPIHMPDGSIRRTEEAYRHGNLDAPLPDGARYLDNTLDELIAVADHMLGETDDCSDWRPPREPGKSIESGPFRVPMPLRDRPLVRFWD